MQSEFEMNNLGKPKRCSGVNMDRVHPDSTPMIGRSLDQRKDPFCPWDDDENVLEAEMLCLRTIWALLYLA